MKGMEMNQSQRVERLRQVARAYAESIGVPRFDAAAVRSRLRVAPPGGVIWRRAGAVAAVLLVITVALGGHAVIAQVERIMGAFERIGGENVPVPVSAVSLDQARRDMPFAVIAPAAIPPQFTEAIDELNPSSSRLDARLVFQFTNGGEMPALTIMESRAARGNEPPPALWMYVVKGPNAQIPRPPAMPALPNGVHTFEQVSRNGQVQRRARIEPITWVVRGTRIDLISPPGVLNNAQLAAIRRAMSY